MRLLLLSLCSMLLVACEAALPPLTAWQSPEQRTHPDVGRILDLNTQQALTPQQLIQHLQSARWVLVGEQHDNPDHHALQEWLLKALSQQRPQNSLLLEMLTPEQQNPVREVQLGLLKGQTPDHLAEALNWPTAWDWKQYGALMTYALHQPYVILPANLSPSEVRTLYQTPTALPGSHTNQPSLQAALLQHLRDSHCQLLPESQLPAMLSIQQHRDRRMATALHAAPQPALLIAGAYHVRRDLGVPQHLADLGSTEGLIVVMLAEVGSSISAQEADIVWFTPAQPQQDHCAQIKPTSSSR